VVGQTGTAVGAASRVVVVSSRCGEVILGGAMLVVWSRLLEKGFSRLSVAA
jgi:hypothetical protein